MNIKLDDEQWQAETNTTLGDVLVDLSDRAHAKSRIVTTMILDQCRITDRDIDQRFLQTPTAQFQNLSATSVTQQDILASARGSIERFRDLVVQEGTSLATQCRTGLGNFSTLDLWLGKVADLLELMEHRGLNRVPDRQAHATAVWVEALLEARHVRDMVRMADLLEYEILPRLAS
ncbi:MAG: hypothetical protein U0236_02175 [Nitrospira sp.]